MNYTDCRSRTVKHHSLNARSSNREKMCRYPHEMQDGIYHVDCLCLRTADKLRGSLCIFMAEAGFSKANPSEPLGSHGGTVC